MIWLWIILALILSFIPLINKKIDASYYIWLLLPIDAYGIVVASTTIKPYMIFALILPIIAYAKNKGTDFDLSASKGQILAGIISVLIIIVNLFNGDSFSSVKAAFMTLVVYVCAQVCVSCTDCKKSSQLTDVFIASCFGCAVVFVLIYICLQSSITLDGFVAAHRSKIGIFMRTVDMKNGAAVEIYRLRGFAYDPTIMFPQFIFGISACISRLFKKFKLYYLVTLILSVFVIILSSSRMGLLCIALAVVITCIVGISQFETVKKKVLSIIGVLSACAVFLGFTATKYGQSVMSSLFSTYTNRSGLTDRYGRFSIWQDCLSVYWEKNPLWGIGLDRLDTFTAIGRTAHNTWLQLICECGIIVGGLATVYFFSIMIMGWSKIKAKLNSTLENASYICLVIGYTVTVISLISTDSITCSYLWFSALLLLKMMADKNSSALNYNKIST
ncbi:MAG: O-antigen ligase family protein [Ruminococcus sp.]|nr:O-antigen ligase family protein [Ruminococcus sp.]